MPLAQDLLYPDPQKERSKHKLKRLVQHPNSYVCFQYFNQVGFGFIGSALFSLWTSSARDATRSLPSSPMPRLWWSVPQLFAMELYSSADCGSCFQVCVGCSTVLCQPTGGKARLVEGCSFRKK